MAEINYYCYICGKKITEENKSDEHIILNAIGGQLHSYTILCKDCNSKMGDHADAQLAKDLSFYSHMLQVKRNRKQAPDIVMKDKEDNDIIVKEAGKNLELRHSSKTITQDGDKKEIRITAKNLKEMNAILKGMVKKGVLTEEQVDKIIEPAHVQKEKPILHTRTYISQEAFPSIIKSAVDYYVNQTHDIATVHHLIPYIKGEKDCKEVLYLHHFKTLPYPENKDEVTHMIHIEGSKETKLLYAMMEYYSIYVYIVILDDNYEGEYYNMTYTYDVVGNREVSRDFKLTLTLKDLQNFRDLPHEEYVKYLPYIQERANKVLGNWQKRSDEAELHDVINEFFSKIPEGKMLDEKDISSISESISKYFVDKIINSQKL